jgi:peptide/nickel transport system permease protein
MGVARLIRGEVLKVRQLDYVSAARAVGSSNSRIVFRHILPNAIAPVLVAATFGVAGAILSETGLGFLGLGVEPPTPSWGELLNQARQDPERLWWLMIYPGFMIFLSVTLMNLVGEGLRDAMDPKLRK